MSKVFRAVNVPAPLWLVCVIFGLTANAQPYFRQLINAGGEVASGNHIVLPSDNDAATPSLAFGDGDTGIYEIGDDNLGIGVAGALDAQISANALELESGTELVLPQDNDDVTPTIRFGDGDSGFYESADDFIGVSLQGGQRWQFHVVQFRSINGNGPRLINETASATNPTFEPNQANGGTGVGWNSTDNGSLVAGDLEAVRWEDPADLAATETSLWLYDDDNAVVEQVTVDAADSCGSGFKCLRIPN